MERTEGSIGFPIGSKMPPFTLQATDGRIVSEMYFDGAKASLIVFGCNHCPYVMGSEEMLIRTIRRFAPQGLRAVMINSNDASQYPEDSFEKMQEKAGRGDLPYAYLYDESQDVAKRFDAQCTPECYLFDASGALVYHGAVNDSPREPENVERNFLAEAIEKALGGKRPDPAFVRPMGCSIKWRRI